MATDGRRLPDAPHWQPRSETITVVRGSLFFGVGKTFQRDGMDKLDAGSVVVVPPRMVHFFMSAGETTIQVHGQRPLDVRFVSRTGMP